MIARPIHNAHVRSRGRLGNHQRRETPDAFIRKRHAFFFFAEGLLDRAVRIKDRVFRFAAAEFPGPAIQSRENFEQGYLIRITEVS